jgi:imidazolonepropionase-like amidohydrolase
MDSLMVECDTPQEIAYSFERMVEFDIDLVKVGYTPSMVPFGGEGWPVMTRQTLAALIERAHRHNLPVIVHFDQFDAGAFLLGMGVDGLEHFPEVQVNDLRTDVARLTELCLKHHAGWSMTLALHEAFSRPGDRSLYDDLGAEEQILPRVFDRMLTDPTSLWNSTGQDVIEYFGGRYEGAMANVKDVHDAGVPMTLSSDSGNHGTVHGVSCRREMELMARAGITPLGIIGCASRVAAEKYGRAGQVEGL